MRGIKKVTLIGNVGTNPDAQYFDSGDAVTNVDLATGESLMEENTGETKVGDRRNYPVFEDHEIPF